MNEIAHGEIGITIDDSSVDSQLRSVQTRYKLAMERIDHMEAKAKLGVDLDRLKAELKEAEAEVKRFEKVAKDSDNAQTQNSLRNARERRKSLAQEIKDTQGLRRAEGERIQVLRTMEQRVAANTRLVGDHAKALKEEADGHRNAALDTARHNQEIARLERQYIKATDKAEKFNKLTKGTTGEARIKAQVEKAGALADMERLKHELAALGRHPPVGIRADLDLRSWEGVKARFGKEVSSLVNRIGTLGHVRLNLGPLSGTLRTFAIGITTLGPLVTSLTAGVGALVGVTGTALVGAGALGAGALTGIGLAAAGTLLTLKPITQEFKIAHGATQNYQKAVLKYGEGSKQAARAQAQMNSALKGVSPEARAAATDLAKFQAQWQRLTSGRGGAQRQFGGIMAGAASAANSIAAPLAKGTNQFAGTLRQSLDPVFRELSSQGAKSGISTIFERFNKSVPFAVGGLNQFGIAFGRISVSASRFLPQVMHAFGSMGTNFANATSNTNHLDAVIGRLVRHATDVMRLFGAGGRVLRDFFNAGANSGDRMVKSLTDTLNKWDQWIRSTQGQHSLHDFFERGRQGTDQFFRALMPLLKAFGEWSNALQPVTTGMLTFVTWLTKGVSALTHLGVAGPALKALGVTLAAIFITTKVAAWVNLIRRAGEYLGIFRDRSITAAAAQRELAGAENLAASGAARETAAQRGAGFPGGGAGPIARSARGGGIRGAAARGLGRVGRVAPFGLTAAFAGQEMGGQGGAAVTGAGIGATIGSVLPGPGTLVGGIAGFIAGATSQMSPGKVKEMKAFGDGFKDVAAKMAVGGAAARGTRAQLAALSEHIRTEGAGKKITADAKRFAQNTIAMQSNVQALRNGAASSIGDLRNRFAQNFVDIEALTKRHSAGARAALDSNMNAAFTNLTQLLHDGRDHTKVFLTQIKDIFSANLKSTGRITRDNFNNIVGTIRQGMKDGSISTKAGMKAIHDYAIQYLIKTLGIQSNNAEVALQRGGVDSAVSSGGGSVGTGGSGRPGGNAARGWIGNPGESGGDNIPIMVGRGEAVINRHQQPVINYALQAIGMSGGLGELFGTIRTPHYMAQGGFMKPEGYASGGPITMSMSPHGVQGLEEEGGLKAAVKATNERLKKLTAQGAMPAGVVPASQAPGGLGVPLAGWIAAAIQWAIQHGWHSPGHLIDLAGFRTGAQQKMLHDRGESPIASGGHHEGTTFPGGAIDLPDAGSRHSLANILNTGPYRGKLRYSDDGWGIQDYVHMSSGQPWGSTSFASGGYVTGGKGYASGGFVVDPHRRGTRSMKDIVGLLYMAGMRGSPEAVAHLAAKTVGESSRNTENVGDGGDSIGLWQIDTAFHPGLSKASLKDPLFNAQQAVKIYRSEGIGAWHAPEGEYGTALHYARYGPQAYAGGQAEKLITMWDDRNLKSASHPAAYWKRLDARYPRARAHWHTTKAAAVKIYDRNHNKKGTAGTGVQGASFLTEGMYGVSDYDLAKAVLTDTTTDDRDALRRRQQQDTKEIARLEDRKAQDERILKRGYWLDKKGKKHKLTASERGRINAELPQLRTDLTSLYGDLKSTNDQLGPLDLAAFFGVNTQSGIAGGGADSGSTGGAAADSADIQAQLAQAQQRNIVLAQSAAISDAFARVAGGPGSIGMGGFTSARSAAQQNDRPTIIINTLHPGDPQTLSAVASAAVSGMDYQGGRTSPRDRVF